jgi:RNA polymerase sigma factor (TIGR02999 family)
MAGASDVTGLLIALSKGDREAANAVMPLVYDELRRIARSRRRQSANWFAPGTTSLVHEVYLNLVDQTRLHYESRGQFYYLASVAMRNLLIDNAKRFHRKKRAGDLHPEPLGEEMLVSKERSDELLLINDLLARLESSNERLCRIVECRFFGGLTVEETAAALSLSPATVKRGWDTARAWLYKELHTSLE